MHGSAGRWAAPDGSPVGTRGWYLASDGVWYRSEVPPAPGHWLGDDGRWHPADGGTAAWRHARWGFGDVWWGLLAYVVAGIAGAVALWATVGGDDVENPGPVEIGVLVGFNAVGILMVLWLATSRKGSRSLRADFGLAGRWVDALVGLGVGVVGVFVAGAVGLGLDEALGADDRTSNVPVDDLPSFGGFAVFFVAVAIVTPVVEELFFRGLVYRSMLKRGRSTVRAIAVTTVVFTIPHLPAVDSWKGAISLFGSIAVLGLAFNLACHWRGNRLMAPIVAHFVVNGLATVALFVS